MQCTHCQTENRPGRRFCAECGVPFALPCASCGFANEPGEKFCGGCGAPLTAAPRALEPRTNSPQAYTPAYLAEKILAARSDLEGERKQVTVLFADIKGSTELIEGLDPEEARTILLRGPGHAGGAAPLWRGGAPLPRPGDADPRRAALREVV